MSPHSSFDQNLYPFEQDCRYYDGIWTDTQRLIAKRLVRERKKKRFSQTALGEIIAYSSSTISLLERGDVFARMDCFLHYCSALGLEQGQLIDEARDAACFAHEQKRLAQLEGDAGSGKKDPGPQPE